MVTIKRKPDFKKLTYEKEAWRTNQLVCGIDEVGRGCFAGPIVAAAAILKPHAKYKYLKDSKELSAEERAIAYKWLMKNSTFAVGIINHRIIDRVTIHLANIYAMKRALFQLLAHAPVAPEIILVDFIPLKFDNLEIPIIHFAKGESLSSSIAAASIIAKVTRDNLMERYNLIFPGYSFDTNKGYGTQAHKNALINLGVLFVHRNSFIKASYIIQPNHYAEWC